MSDIRVPSKLNRRRFLTISASALAGTALAPIAGAAAPRVHRWTGMALGARAEIILLLNDPEMAKAMFGEIEAEVRRLEGIFSLYKAESELVRLNRDGHLSSPSLEMVELLGLSRQIHDLTEGAFDPTVQPLWDHHAHQASMPGMGHAGDLESLLDLVDFASVVIEPSEIGFRKPGMSMTLNGIAQGFITDRIAKLLKSRGCTDVVVDLGEISAIGRADIEGDYANDGWPVRLRPDPSRPDAEIKVTLKDAAVASSARRGTTFDEAARKSHILDPRTGLPVHSDLEAASVIANSAVIADGLSTAAPVLGEAGLLKALNKVHGASGFVLRADGSSGWLALS